MSLPSPTLDLTSVALLLFRGNNGDSSILSLVPMLLIPILLPKFITLCEKIYKSFFSKFTVTTWNTLLFDGNDSLWACSNYYDYPRPYLALSHYANKNNKCSLMRYFTTARNGRSNHYSLDMAHDKTPQYIIDTSADILMDPDIYLDLTCSTIEDKQNTNQITIKTLKLKSQRYSVEYLREYVIKRIAEYDKYMDEQQKNKLYHFVYTGKKDSGLQFSHTILSDFDDSSKTNYVGFNHIFNDSKDKIERDIKRLHDISYYQRNGLKRKKGYLFYGPPGCCKSYTVTAIAVQDKRHIIEIPMSRIKTNSELEALLSLNEIHGIKFNDNTKLILFDEIDTGGEAVNKRVYEQSNNKLKSEEKENKDKDKDTKLGKVIFDALSSSSEYHKPDELNIGTLLSRIDGVGNYDGIMIIATTNCETKLSPALCRHGRLDPIYFGYSRKIDIINYIEHRFNVKLTKEETDNLPDVDHKLTPSSIMKYLDDFDNNYRDLLTFLKAKQIPPKEL